jgi:hypothetical protein
MAAKTKKTQEIKDETVEVKPKKVKKVKKSLEVKLEKPEPVKEIKVGRFKKTFESIKKWFREIEAELKKE